MGKMIQIVHMSGWRKKKSIILRGYVEETSKARVHTFLVSTTPGMRRGRVMHFVKHLKMGHFF